MREQGKKPSAHIASKLIFLTGLIFIGLHLAFPEFEGGMEGRKWFNLNAAGSLVSWFRVTLLLLSSCIFWVIHKKNARGFLSTGVALLGSGLLVVFAFFEFTHVIDFLKFQKGEGTLFAVLSWAAIPMGLLYLFGVATAFLDARDSRSAFQRHSWLFLWGIYLAVPLWNSMPMAKILQIPKVVGPLLFLLGLLQLFNLLTEFYTRPYTPIVGSVLKEKQFVFKKWQVYVYGAVYAFLGGLLYVVLGSVLRLRHGVSADPVAMVGGVGLGVGWIVAMKNSQRKTSRVLLHSSVLLAVSMVGAFGACLTFRPESVLFFLAFALPFGILGFVLGQFAKLGRLPIFLVFGVLAGGLGSFSSWLLYPVFRAEGTFLWLVSLALMALPYGLRFGTFIEKRSGRIHFFGVLLCGGLFALGAVGVPYNNWLNITQEQNQTKEVLLSKSTPKTRLDILWNPLDSSGIHLKIQDQVSLDLENLEGSALKYDPRITPRLKQGKVVFLNSFGGTHQKVAENQNAQVILLQEEKGLWQWLRTQLANGEQGTAQEVLVSSSLRELMETYKGQIEEVQWSFTTENLARQEEKLKPEFLKKLFALLRENGRLSIQVPVNNSWEEVGANDFIHRLAVFLQGEFTREVSPLFYTFFWSSHGESYYQILVKKKAFTPGELFSLNQWRKKLSRTSGNRKAFAFAPLATQLLHAPGKKSQAEVHRLLLEVDAGNPRIMAKGVSDERLRKLQKSQGRSLWFLLLAFSVGLLFYLTSDFNKLRREDVRYYLPTSVVVALAFSIFVSLGFALEATFAKISSLPLWKSTLFWGFSCLCLALGVLSSGKISARWGKGLLLLPGAVAFSLALFQREFSAWLLSVSEAIGMGIVFMTLLFVTIPIGVFFGRKIQWVEESFGPKGVPFLYFGIPFLLPVWFAFAKERFWGGAPWEAFVAFCIFLGLTALFEGLKKYRNAVGILAGGLLLGGVLLFGIWQWIPENGGQHGYEENRWNVYALQYGKTKVPKSTYDSRILRGEQSTTDMIWLLQKGGHYVLVNTGPQSQRKLQEKGVEDFENIHTLLYRMGITPEYISDIILTHGYWDAVGHLDRFKNARVWIHENAFENIRYGFSSLYSPISLKHLQKKKDEGLLHPIAGDRDLFEGLGILESPGVTNGSQSVRVDSQMGWVVLSGELNPFYSTAFYERTGLIHNDMEGAWKSLRQMKKQAGSPLLFLPSKDPAVFAKFPVIQKGITEVNGRVSE